MLTLTGEHFYLAAPSGSDELPDLESLHHPSDCLTGALRPEIGMLINNRPGKNCSIAFTTGYHQ